MGINDFKDYLPRTNIVNDEKGDLVTPQYFRYLEESFFLAT